MRITEQLSEDDAGDPPSLKVGKTYQDILFDAQNNLKIFPPYPEFRNESGDFKVSLFDDYDNIEIEAVIQGRLVERYHRLNAKDREHDILAYHVQETIGGLAVAMFGSEVEPEDTTVLINNVPVIIEPLNNAMLVGKWDDEWEKRKLIIKSACIEDHDQQRLLLGGLAAFVTYLEQQ
jgi:hypothetical protein